MLELILGGVAAAAVGGLVWLARRHSAARERLRLLQEKYGEQRVRFAPIVDVETEVARARQSIEEARAGMERERAEARAAAEAEAARLKAQFNDFRQRAAAAHAAASARQEELAHAYQQARVVFDRLQGEVTLLEENLEDISFGVYRPHFEYATSQGYRDRLEQTWQEQKDLIKLGRHVVFGVAWTIGDSRKEGERMQKQYGKLLLRAFNGECDACIAKVTWNNATRMEERIRKGFESINDLGGVMKISVTPEYRELRLQELRLHHELEEKKRDEAEEQRRLREQMREEERAQRELEKARQDAEDEEHRYERALERARAELTKAKGAEVEALNERMRELQAELDEAHLAKERAISRAQMTKSGHVYIISNVGSFGEDVVKIGMTRRLEPVDRVKELGDASVPFEFDIHGLVYSEDAPALEAELHRQFRDHRVNLVNHRKEFFRVALREIDDYLRAQQKKVELTLLAEAREFRETMSLRQKVAAAAEVASAQTAATSAFPEKLF